MCKLTLYVPILCGRLSYVKVCLNSELWICFCDCNTWPNYVTVNKLEPQARHRDEIAMLVTSGTKQWQGTDS